MRIICRELESAWQVLTLKFEFEDHQNAEQIQHLMNPEEKTLSLSFELTVAENRGTLNLVFPAVVSNALLRKMSADWVRSKRRTQPDSSERLRNHVLECPFSVELGMRVASVRLAELLQFAPGSVLRLHCPVHQPAALRIGEREMFSAIVARRGRARAAQVLAPPRTTPERKSQP